MSIEQWEHRLDASQAEQLPLIVSGILGVQILATARDYLVIGLDLPLWLSISNFMLIAVMVGVVASIRLLKIPNSQSYVFAGVAMLCAAAKAIVSIVAQAEPLPFYMGVLMFASSLVFLSMRYMLLCAAVITVAWGLAVFDVLSITEIVSTFVAIVLGVALALLVLSRRIAASVKVYELQHRLETLESILPMCASCKKTRNAAGDWRSVEEFIEEKHEGMQVSHGVCPDCTKELYGDYLDKREAAS